MMETKAELSALEDRFEKNKDKFFEDFFTFLRFKSVSTEASYRDEVFKCLDWLEIYIQAMGLKTERWETDAYPTLYAHYDKAGPDKPTLLIYNHYDIQPVDPLKEWSSAPFEAEFRNGEIYARGAQDNKGQCFYTLAAIKTLLDRDASLPINLKLCIEGEEEAGSTGLLKLAKEKQKELQADHLAIVDLGISGPTTPSIALGMRGLLTLEMEVEGSNSDLHSGQHGGLVYNPNHAIVELLAMLRDKNGKVKVPGFYDDVKQLTEEELSQVSFDFDQADYERRFKTKAIGGEKDYSPMESNWLRPTLEINGVAGGYFGDGFKTVIPRKAIAKMSCRLAYGQDPQKTGKQIKDYLEANAPEGVNVNVNVLPGGGPSMRSSPNGKIIKIASKAYSEVYKKDCIFTLEGATIPVAAELVKASGAELLLMGLGLDDDNIHAPDEHFGIDRMQKGFLIIARLIKLLGQG